MADEIKKDQEEKEENITPEEQVQDPEQTTETSEENITPENQNIEQPQDQITDPNLNLGMMGGVPENDEPPVTLPDVVRKYELKKIYIKLHSIENFLFNNNVFTKKMIVLQKNVTTAIDLFDYIIENLTVYRKKVDKIIDIFNKFINDTTKLLKKYSDEIEE